MAVEEIGLQPWLVDQSIDGTLGECVYKLLHRKHNCQAMSGQCLPQKVHFCMQASARYLVSPLCFPHTMHKEIARVRSPLTPQQCGNAHDLTGNGH